jgi:hypothetical protein
MELPVGVEDSRERLMKLHRQIERMKRSPVPAVNFAVLKFANLLPTWIIKRTMVTNYFPTIILSNFPVSETFTGTLKAKFLRKSENDIFTGSTCR